MLRSFSFQWVVTEDKNHASIVLLNIYRSLSHRVWLHRRLCVWFFLYMDSSTYEEVRFDFFFFPFYLWRTQYLHVGTFLAHSLVSVAFFVHEIEYMIERCQSAWSILYPSHFIQHYLSCARAYPVHKMRIGQSNWQSFSFWGFDYGVICVICFSRIVKSDSREES